MDKKIRPIICCVQGTHFRPKDRLEVRGQKKIFLTNGNEKKSYVYQTKYTLQQKL